MRKQVNYIVLLPAVPTPSEQFAAEELVRFFEEATGYSPAVVREGEGAVNGPCLSIGGTVLFSACGGEAKMCGVGTDVAIVFTNGENFFINSPSESGKIYAVYEFLHAQFGFTVYAADEIYIEKTQNFALKKVDIVSAPDFVGRDVHSHALIYDPLLSVRMRSNGVRTDFPPQYGEGCFWSKKYWCHATFQYLPPEKYAADHPSWYTDNKLQLCIATALENSEEGRLMYGTFLENLKKAIASEPQAKYFSIGQEDVGYTCDREISRKANAKYGGESAAPSGTYLVFANRLAADVKAWLRSTASERANEVKLVMFAYQKTQQPPVTFDTCTGRYVCAAEVSPAENVIVRFAPLASVYSKNFLDEEYNAPARNALLGWSGIGAHLAVWTYDVCFGTYLYPMYNWHVLQENYRIFKKCGVCDVLVQGSCDTEGTPFFAMRNYVHSRLLWNTEADVSALVKDFMAHYYRDAAKYVYMYYELLNAHFKTIEITMGYLAYAGVWETQDNCCVWYYPKEFLESALKIFADARRAAETISDLVQREKVLRRVRAEELSPRFMMLDLYRQYLGKKQRYEAIKAFAADAKELGAQSYREGGSMDSIAERWLNELNYGTPVEFL
mgnify:CR=1 FL=1